MAKRKICIEEVAPILKQILNMNGFCKMIGKSASWFHDKVNKRVSIARVVPGFTSDNIELINNGIKQVVDYAKKHTLQLPEECPNREIYNKYIQSELKDLRKLVRLIYIRENYTDIPKSSFDKKLINAVNRGTVAQFTDSDVRQINNGIEKIVEFLSSLEITL